MKDHIPFEKHKIIFLLILLIIFLAGISLPTFHMINIFLHERDIRYIFLICLDFFFLIVILKHLITLLKNYNRINYFIVNEQNFAYLIIPDQKFASRTAILDRIISIYFKPKYRIKSFKNVVEFKSNNYNQIYMKLEDNSTITIPLYLSNTKLEKSLEKLNSRVKVTNKNFC